MSTRAVLLTGCLILGIGGCERAAEPPPLPATVDRLDPAVVSLLEARRRAVVADPLSAARWHDLALAEEANELFTEALDCVTEAVRLDPGSARGWYQLGRLAVRAGDLERGRESFLTAQRLAIDYAPAAWQVGMIDLDRGRFREAEAAFERALTIDPAAAAAHLGLARAWLGQGRVTEAAERLEAIVGTDASARPYALHLLASAHRRMGRSVEHPPAAAAPRWHDPWTSELDQLRPGYGARIDEARRDLDAGRLEAARSALRLLHAESPANPVVTATLARAEREAGQPAVAIALLRETLTRRPGFFPAHFELAVTFAQQSTAAPFETAAELRARADAAATRTLELNPAYAPAHALRGDLATVAGQLDVAARHYADAQRCDRTDPRWPQRCGIAALRRGDWPSAQRWLERAVAMQPDDAEGQRGLAVALMSQGRLDAAGAALARAAALRPGDPMVAQAQRHLQTLRTENAP